MISSPFWIWISSSGRLNRRDRSFKREAMKLAKRSDSPLKNGADPKGPDVKALRDEGAQGEGEAWGN